MSAHPPLDAIFWNTLTGAHAPYASGTGGARRYTAGFSPIIAFADNAAPDFAALAPVCAAGEHFYCEGWQGACPAGWRVDVETTMFRMVWDAAVPTADMAPDAIVLGAEHGAAAMALAELCQPGPFGPRTIELGTYFSIVDQGRLVAMAGQRTRVPGYTEISGVCTHPDYQGRGLARQLMGKLIHHQMLAGELPFLHVMRSNEAARQFYLRMGFRDYIESSVRVLTRLG